MWILIIFLILLVFIFLAFLLLPKLILKINYSGVQPNDHISKMVDTKYASATVYDHDDKRFIEQYALVQKDGYKEVICKLHESVKTIDYDIVLFDESGKVKNIISLSENSKNNLTRTTKINNKIDSIMIVIKKVNGADINIKFSKKYSKTSIIIYSIISTIFFFISTYIILQLIINKFSDVFFESIIKSPLNIIILISSTIIYFITSFIIVTKRRFN